MITKIFLYDTQRELLIFLLLIELKEEIIYVYMNDKKIIDKLFGKKIQLKKLKLTENKYINKIKILFWGVRNRIYLKILLKTINFKKLQIFGYNHTLYNYIFLSEKKYVIEDGLKDYIPEVYKKNLKSKLVKKIYYTETLIKKFKIEEHKKIQKLNLQNLWDKQSFENKQRILEIFDVDISILRELEDKKIILFTQPLSEDGFITEKEKIEIYKKILKNYKEKKVVIKPHPREETDYLKYFPNFYILEAKYPIELLVLNGLKIDKVITLFSTAVFNFGYETEIDFYGTEVHKNIFNYFGSMDHIMKRNKFL